MELIATKDIVLQLKAVKAEKDLSWADIKAMLKKNGDYLAQSTLQRVFADGSEEDTFRYESTLAPLVRALLWQGSGDKAQDAAVADATTADAEEGTRSGVTVAQLRYHFEHSALPRYFHEDPATMLDVLGQVGAFALFASLGDENGVAYDYIKFKV